MQRRDMSAEQQDQQWRAIWDLIGCTSEAERSRVQRQANKLLTQPLEVLQQRLTALAAALGGDAAAAKAACRRAPTLLTVGSEVLQHNAAQLQQLLGADSGQLAKLVSKQPAILGNSPDTLASNLQAVTAHFGSMQAAVKACVRQSSLLYQDPGSLAAKAAALQVLLGLESSAQLAPVLRASPALLACDPDSLKATVQQLERALSMPRGEVQAMVVARSSLLTTTPEVTAAKWRLMQAYTGPAGSLGLSSIARCLCAAFDRLARLEYLATVVAVADPGAKLPALYTAVLFTDAAFNARYPGFPAWLAANAARLEDENPPLELRGKDAAAAAAAARDPSKQRPRGRRRGAVLLDESPESAAPEEP